MFLLSGLTFKNSRDTSSSKGDHSNRKKKMWTPMWKYYGIEEVMQLAKKYGEVDKIKMDERDSSN